jgi:GTPase
MSIGSMINILVDNDINHISSKKRKRLIAIDDTGYEEITIALIGNVDSGKSSTIGVITNPGILDNGKGSSRERVMIHPHELESGRTSDITYQYYKDDDDKCKRIYTFIDLAGHESYLRTTISGLASGYPDMAICCISDKITHITKEHLTLAVNMGIPILVIFTKIDFIPQELTKSLCKYLKDIISKTGRKLFRIDNINDYEKVKIYSKVIPYIYTSNKTGVGIPLVRELMRLFPRRNRVFVNGFAIETVYNIPGYGTVVSGQVGQTVKKGDELYLGPLNKGEFITVKVKTLHNDYRYFVNELSAGKRGCLCIKIAHKYKPILRTGMVLRSQVPDNVCRSFQSKVKIFHHHTSIKKGYQAYINCGMVRGPVIFTSIQPLINGTPVANFDVNNVVLRSGQEALIDMIFIMNLNYIELGQTIVFREGVTKGIGIVSKLY